MFRLEIETGNAAFTDELHHTFDDYYKRQEICRILDTVKEYLNAGYTEHSIGDYYGNRVGEWTMD